MPCECAGGGWCTDNREVLAIGHTLTAHQVRNKVQHQLLLIYCWFIDNVYGAAFTEQSHQDGSDMPCWVAIIFRQGRDKFRVDASQCRFVDRKSVVTFDWHVNDWICPGSKIAFGSFGFAVGTRQPCPNCIPNTTGTAEEIVFLPKFSGAKPFKLNKLNFISIYRKTLALPSIKLN